ncbi:MAG: YkgJ family cysteine cluster protein [Zavarzinella sp.]|nr:YkgJ family cysteine cluster protein [Zavarzinella sp.]
MPDHECDGCGACCGTFPVFASAADGDREVRIASEARKLPEHLATPGHRFQLFPLPFHETCCFLDEAARCTIYATRPDVCRAFPAGGDQCQEARARIGLPPLAPAAHGGLS